MKIMPLKRNMCFWITPPYNKGEVMRDGTQAYLVDEFKDPRGFCIDKFPYETDADPRLKGSKELKKYVENFFESHDGKATKKDIDNPNAMFWIDRPEDREINVKEMDYEALVKELEELRKKVGKA